MGRREGEKGLVDRFAHEVQPRLEAVDEFVDAAGDDLLDIAVVEFRPQPPQPLLGRRAERARPAARDRQQRILGAEQAKVHRAGEVAVENQELGHLGRRGAAVPLAIHLQGTDALQQGNPLVRVDRRAHVGRAGQQQVVFDVEDPRGLVGPLDRHRQPAEVPGLAPRHRRFGHAFQQRPAQLDLAEELERRGQDALVLAGVADHEIELVQFLPHLRTDHVAHRAGVLAGGAEAGKDRVGVLFVERQPPDHVALRCHFVSARKTPRGRRWSRSRGSNGCPSPAPGPGPGCSSRRSRGRCFPPARRSGSSSKSNRQRD